MKPGLTIALLGPTGVGKTAVAVELAGLLGLRIIACDSMQVYRGFPVLTNQPRHAEERPELHDLVGLLGPQECMTAGEYAALATPLVDRSVSESGAALLVGGSGLYMRAALAPLAARGPADPDLRSSLEQRAREEGPQALHQRLAELDPLAAAQIDPRNTRRVIRAIEGVMTTGVDWSGRDDLWEPDYHRGTLIVGLQMDRGLLGERIALRTFSMFDEGAVAEVERFREEGGPEATRPGLPGICSAIGYGEIAGYLSGALDRLQAIERMSAATRRYARRQGTWLRKVKGAVMIEAGKGDPVRVARQIAGLAAEVKW